MVTPGGTGPPRLAQLLRRGPLGRGQLPGSSFGPYEVVGELGRGGYGVVVRAQRRDAAGPDVALKVLLDDGAAAVSRARRFEREVRLTRSLRHPGIVAVLDAGQHDGVDFVALELVEGRTLERELEAVFAGPDRARGLELITQVARAVSYAHRRGVIHRDLKPANVLVRARDGKALVTDFGLARDLATGSSLTKTGAVLGTPDYMSPEQIGGKEATPAADVFALGAMLYLALTGKLPFHTENLAQRYAAVLMGKFDPPTKVRPGTPAGFDAVVRRALAAKPEERYPDAGAFADAMDAVVGRPSVSLETIEETAEELKARGLTREMFLDAPELAEWKAPLAPPARPAWLVPALVVLGLLVVAALVLGALVVRQRRAARLADEAQARHLAEREALLGAAGELRAGRLDAAEARLGAASASGPAASAEQRRGVEVGRGLLLVARGQAGALELLGAPPDPWPWTAGEVDLARARALLAAGRAAEALALLERTPPADATPARLLLRARLLFPEQAPLALEAWEAGLAAGAAPEPDLEPLARRALVQRASRALGRSDDLGLEAATHALADVRRALGADRLGAANLSAAELDDAGAARRLGRAAQGAGHSLLSRQASRTSAAPSVDAVRVGLGLLDAARACDAGLAQQSGLVELLVSLCQLERCPPQARYLVASFLRRRRVAVDAARDLRLADPQADFAGAEARLQGELQAAAGDASKVHNAYRTFSHLVRSAFPLLAWEAEEEALTLWPDEAPGRFHLLLARGVTLAALGRAQEGVAPFDEAVRLCDDGRQPELLWADTLFWRCGHQMALGRLDAALGDWHAAVTHQLRAGRPVPNGWWFISLSSILRAQKRHDEALGALAGAYGFGDPGDAWVDRIKAELLVEAGR